VRLCDRTDVLGQQPGVSNTGEAQRPPEGPAHAPLRMCVGCRLRAPASELIRFVAAGTGDDLRLLPDPSRRLPGRGAHLHPDPACFALAERRRAFGRALRVTGVLDTTPLHEYLAATGPSGAQFGPTGGAGIQPVPTEQKQVSGNERAMKSSR